MKIYGTWDTLLIEQLAKQENVSGYLSAVMEEYQFHGNFTTVQLALRYVVEAQGGISKLAKRTDIDPQLLSKVLASEKAPRIDTLRTVLSALGCCLSITSLETVSTHINAATEESTSAPLRKTNANLELDEYHASTE